MPVPKSCRAAGIRIDALPPATASLTALSNFGPLPPEAPPSRGVTAVKKLLSSVTIAALTLLALAQTYAIAFPGEARAMLRGDSTSSQRRPAVVQTGNEGASRAPASRPAPKGTGKPAASESREIAQAEPKPTPAQGRKPAPPPRKQAPPKRDDTKQAQTRALRRATAAGSSDSISSAQAPQPELYPFTPERRTTPTKGTLRIELRMKNNSGIYWESATIALSTPVRKDALLYRIDGWRDQEEIMIDYAFPEAEMESRLTQLRVVSVTGAQARAALADMFNEQRQEFAMAAGRQDQTEIPRTGEKITAPGLLGLLASARAPFAQQPAAVASYDDVARVRRVEVIFPEEHAVVLPDTEGLPSGTKERTAATKLFTESSAKAVEIQDQLKAFIATLKDQTYEDAMAANGPAMISGIRQSLREFTSGAVDLSVLAESTGDGQIERLQARLLEYSDRLTRQVTSIEVQVRRHDPQFSIQN